jgi:biopolymer transport protein TolR
MPQLSSGRKKRRTMNEINMVPFIDVMLVLLIIFMVTAPLITPSVIQLPTMGQAPRQPDQVIQIIVDANAQLEVREGKTKVSTTLNQVAAQVIAMQDRIRETQVGNPSTAVVISADKSVAYEQVVNVMDALQQAGISRVGLSVTTRR